MKRFIHRLALPLLLAVVFAASHSPALAAAIKPILIPLALVTDTGNAPDSTVMVTDSSSGYGEVDYPYSIAKYDVTVAQYAAFLNAVARDDTYGLYNSNMQSQDRTRGIRQSGVPGIYTYSVIGNGQNPICFVSWLNAARFCNWLQNGEPASGGEGPGATETGAYTLNGDIDATGTTGLETANPGSAWRLPTEDEWYKAAFYDPSIGGAGGYWPFATRSAATPGNDYKTRSTVANQANYRNASNLFSVTQSSNDVSTQNYLTPVGSFTKSPTYYGTYDQDGDVWQWNDAIGDNQRGIRGGAWDLASTYMQANYRDGRSPSAAQTGSITGIGFRVAGPPALDPVGKFTLLLSASETDPTIPQGIGYATLVASSAGSAVIAGKLPDGENFGVSGAAIVSGSTGNAVTFNISLTYPDVAQKAFPKGSLAGTLTFSTSPGVADIQGVLEWTKPAQKSGPYPAAIAAILNVAGSAYTAPAKHASVLPGFTSGTLELSDTGALSASASSAIILSTTLNSSNKLLLPNPATDSLKISITPSTGLIQGTFKYPGQTSLTKFFGALFQDQSNAAGFFIGPNGAGTVTLTGS